MIRDFEYTLGSSGNRERVDESILEPNGTIRRSGAPQPWPKQSRNNHRLEHLNAHNHPNVRTCLHGRQESDTMAVALDAANVGIPFGRRRPVVKRFELLTATVLFGILACLGHAQTVWYVDDNSIGGLGNGLSWEAAFSELQSALALAQPSDEIRVAEGTYKPDFDVNTESHTGDRNASFLLLNGVTLNGGFAGNSAADPDLRDATAFETVLTGDLATDDELGFVNRGDNSYHVLTGNGTDETAVIDGFTISGGNADGTAGIPVSAEFGGGMFVLDGYPTLRNCLFLSNIALDLGGALYIRQSETTEPPSPIISQCTFRGNHAGDRGGGAFILRTDALLTQCVFEDNSAWNEGGGLYNFSSNVVVTGCTFANNFISFGSGTGGGIYNTYSSPIVGDSSFIGNVALDGGGMANNRSYPVLRNCTFTGNDRWALTSRNSSHVEVIDGVFSDNWLVLDAVTGGTMLVINSLLANNDSTVVLSQGSKSHISLANCSIVENTGTGIKVDSGRVTVRNSILWGNTSGLDLISHKPIADVTHSCIQGGWPGVGNIAADPLLAPGPDGSYYLSQVAAGQAVDSPCVDASSDTAASVGLAAATTRTDEITDAGMVDMGYHYGAAVDVSVPAVSEWGMIIIALLLLTAGTMLCVKRRIPLGSMA